MEMEGNLLHMKVIQSWQSCPSFLLQPHPLSLSPQAYSIPTTLVPFSSSNTQVHTLLSAFGQAVCSAWVLSLFAQLQDSFLSGPCSKANYRTAFVGLLNSTNTHVTPGRITLLYFSLWHSSPHVHLFVYCISASHPFPLWMEVLWGQAGNVYFVLTVSPIPRRGLTSESALNKYLQKNSNNKCE